MSESTRGQALDIKRHQDTAAYRRKLGKPTLQDIVNAGQEAGRASFAYSVQKYGLAETLADFEKRNATVIPSFFRYESAIGRDTNANEQSLFISSAGDAIHELAEDYGGITD